MTLAPSRRHGPRALLNARTQAAFTSTDTALVVVKQGAGDRQAAGMGAGGHRPRRRPWGGRPTREAVQTAHRAGFWPSSPVQRIGDSEPQTVGGPGAGASRDVRTRAVFPAARSVAHSADLAVQISLRSAQVLHSTGINCVSLIAERLLQQYLREGDGRNRRIVWKNSQNDRSRKSRFLAPNLICAGNRHDEALGGPHAGRSPARRDPLPNFPSRPSMAV
jgi:hypothetical protein